MAYTFSNVDNQLQIISDDAEVNLKNPICEKTVDSKIRVYDNFGMYERFFRFNDITEVDGQTPLDLSEAYSLLKQICIDLNGSSVQKNPTILRPTTSGTIAAGTNAVSIANVGAADGTVATITLKAGETINFDAGESNTLTSIAYDATGTTFLIITIS